MLLFLSALGVKAMSMLVFNAIPDRNPSAEELGRVNLLALKLGLGGCASFVLWRMTGRKSV